ncbi:MAG: pantetheine-phosphate adenylyltransferase [Fimbriimonadaceae bacterium]|nr:pantetheine-phosphate adenylyltransferase [Fimbriimonadaceae bacterium]
MTALVPGTFDPLTLGHFDVIRRAAALFDEVLVAVAPSSSKGPWFSQPERAELAAEACRDLPNVRVDTFQGLLVQYAEQQGCRVIVKGLRAVSDFEFELQMAHANRLQAPRIETLFVMADGQHSFLSSSIVRELARFGGDLSLLVPPNIIEPVRRRAAERNREARHIY